MSATEAVTLGNEVDVGPEALAADEEQRAQLAGNLFPGGFGARDVIDPRTVASNLFADEGPAFVPDSTERTVFTDRGRVTVETDSTGTTTVSQQSTEEAGGDIGGTVDLDPNRDGPIQTPDVPPLPDPPDIPDLSGVTTLLAIIAGVIVFAVFLWLLRPVFAIIAGVSG